MTERLDCIELLKECPPSDQRKLVRLSGWVSLAGRVTGISVCDFLPLSIHMPPRSSRNGSPSPCRFFAETAADAVGSTLEPERDSTHRKA